MHILIPYKLNESDEAREICYYLLDYKKKYPV